MMDSDGNQIRVLQFTDYTADKVRSIYRNAASCAAIGRTLPARNHPHARRTQNRLR
jgi:hypothetical protein